MLAAGPPPAVARWRWLAAPSAHRLFCTLWCGCICSCRRPSKRGFALVDALGIVALLQWLLHVRRSVPAATPETRSGDTLVRWGQADGIAYGLAGTMAPEARRHQFLNALAEGVALDNPMFWLFAAPVLVAVLSGVSGLCLLRNRRPDIIEQRRVVAMLLAIPLFGASFAPPEEIAVVSLLLGAMVFLVGAVPCHVEQGRRGEFMAQFLSLQVAEMVRRQGLAGAAAPARLKSAGWRWICALSPP